MTSRRRKRKKQLLVLLFILKLASSSKQTRQCVPHFYTTTVRVYSWFLGCGNPNPEIQVAQRKFDHVCEMPKRFNPVLKDPIKYLFLRHDKSRTIPPFWWYSTCIVLYSYRYSRTLLTAELHCLFQSKQATNQATAKNKKHNKTCAGTLPLVISILLVPLLVDYGLRRHYNAIELAITYLALMYYTDLLFRNRNLEPTLTVKDTQTTTKRTNKTIPSPNNARVVNFLPPRWVLLISMVWCVAPRRHPSVLLPLMAPSFSCRQPTHPIHWHSMIIHRTES